MISTPSNSAVINVQAVSKHFMAQRAQEKIEVLKDINFSLNIGDTLAIVGSSGSGKSTLLALLAGLDFPTSGAIHFMNADMVAMNEDDLSSFRAQHLGMVFQRFHLLPHLTAVENCALPLDLLGTVSPKESLERAQALLASVNLSHRAQHFPSMLSGGECQRVAIARSLIASPSLILADEPTGNLDDEHAEQVAQLLFERVRERGVAMILVTHNLALAKQCTRVLRLHNGVLNPAASA